MKRILFYILFFNFKISLCQTITPSVINSGGTSKSVTINGNPAIYTDNIGEAIITTGANSTNILTQGFLQPDMAVVNGVLVAPLVTPVSCADKGDGKIFMEMRNFPPPNSTNPSVRYYWTPKALCPNDDCQQIDSLSAGSFTVKVVWMYTIGTKVIADSSKSFIVKIDDKNGICNIKVFTGVTTKGSNNKFTIENIELYPNANVTIFNRWGKSLFSKKGYNNTDNYWPAKNEQVMPGTYFYVIELEGKMNRGWVEVFDY